VSNRHYRDEFSDVEDETYAMLGSRFRKVARDGNDRGNDRRRHADSEPDHRVPLRKAKRHRDRMN